jgi:hypothetical protein
MVGAGCTAQLDPELVGPMHMNSEAPSKDPTEKEKEPQKELRAYDEETGKPLKYPGNNKPVMANVAGSKRADQTTNLGVAPAFPVSQQQCMQNADTPQ